MSRRSGRTSRPRPHRTTRLAAAAVVIGTAGGIVACSDSKDARPAASTAPSGNNAASNLFTMSATGGSFTPTSGSSYRLSLTGVSPTTIQFTDRPARKASAEPTTNFVDDWTALFGTDPPNAAVVLTEASSSTEDTVVATLRTPTFDASTNTVTFEASVVEDVPDTSGVAFAAASADPKLPSSFGSVSLFIDNAGSIPGGGATTSRPGTAASSTTARSGGPSSSGSSPPASGAESTAGTTGSACSAPGSPTDPAAFYVTFSGEAGKLDGKNPNQYPIDNVWGFTASGTPLAVDTKTGGVLTGTDALQAQLLKRGLLPDGAVLDELRGMAIVNGQLYVASAHKSQTMLLQFGAVSAQTRTPVSDQPWAMGPDWGNLTSPANVTGLVHPYGLAANGSTLYVTTQDTNLGLALDTTQTGMTVTQPTAAWLTAMKPKVAFFNGTFAPAAAYASGVPPTGVTLPAVVDSGSGGLEGARAVVFDPTRSLIHVADNANASVKAYDATTGAYAGKIWDGKKNNPGSKTPAPVGLAVSGNTLFVGDEANNDVVSIDLSGYGSGDTSATAKVAVATDEPGPNGTTVTIDATAGLAVDNAGALYVNSRKGFAINRYTLTNGSVAAACVFTANLPDTPEQIVTVPAS